MARISYGCDGKILVSRAGRDWIGRIRAFLASDISRSTGLTLRTVSPSLAPGLQQCCLLRPKHSRAKGCELSSMRCRIARWISLGADDLWRPTTVRVLPRLRVWEKKKP